MAIYDYTETTSPTPSRMVRRLVSNGAVLRSALSTGTQTISRAGEHWELDVEWLNVTGDELADLRAFLGRLNGPEHRVQFHQFDVINRGDWDGTGGFPVVDGAGQTGNQLNIRDATPSITGYARAGDLFALDHGAGQLELKMATVDADTDAGGTATIEFIPRIRLSPADGRPLDGRGNVFGLFILSSAVETNAAAPAGRGPGQAVVTVRASFIEDVKA